MADEIRLPALLTIREVAEYTGLNKFSVYRMIRKGRLRAVTLGTRARRVTAEDLKTFMRSSEETKPGAILRRLNKKKESDK